MKKIAFLIMDFSHGAGTERVTSIISNELSKKNWECTIISCANGTNPQFELDKKIKLLSLHGEKIKNKLLRKIHNIIELKKIQKEYKFDCIVAVDVALFLYLLPFVKNKNVKCIAWEHFNCYTVQNAFSKISRKLATKYSDCIIVLGKNDLNNYKSKYNHIKKIEYIYNPIAIDSTKNTKLDNKNIIAVGRLEDQKGFDYLINVWEILEKRIPEWKLNIYGEGSKKNDLLNMINSKKLKNIKINDFTPNIKEKYLDSSIYVLSSRYEGFVLVLLEAQACGLPCVSFNCKEGPAEIIDDGVNGYLIDCYDIEEMANKIEILANDKVKLKSFSDNSKKDLYRFDTKNIIVKWEKILKDVIEK